jgi:hypothetical protein
MTAAEKVYIAKLLVDIVLPINSIMHCSLLSFSARIRIDPEACIHGFDLSEKKVPFSRARDSRRTGRNAPVRNN